MHKPGLFGMNGFMVFLLSFFTVAARAQQPGFLILIEAENKQSFTVRLGDEIFPSSAQGHLVLSQLKDSSYRIGIRFPKNNLPEQVFPVVIHKKDLGFQLKGAESTWVLFNWQTRETIRPVLEFDSSRILNLGVKREDGFSKLMAAVVDDSTVMYNTYAGNGFKQDSSNAKGQRKEVDSTQLTVNRQHPTVSGQPSTANGQAPTAKIPPPIPPKEVLPSHENVQNSQQSTVNSQLSTVNRQPTTKIAPSIKKLREVSLKISRKIVYQDIGKDGQIDTITLFVFFETNDSLVKKPAIEPAVASVKQVKSSDSSAGNKLQLKNKAVSKSGEPPCTQTATEEDVAFLRDLILKANILNDKIAIASEAFTMKCFTVSQVRLLASLFVSDKDKYRLMDAAHQHVSDKDHFRELVDMLTDKNFQRKFLVMADKRS
ncbi:MAG TPA: DUF4476 domain-containing protein [Puia sp.]|jgi:hypothetical protein|nr:DUF4476 domain-containing protein [Puia sp.]